MGSAVQVVAHVHTVHLSLHIKNDFMSSTLKLHDHACFSHFCSYLYIFDTLNNLFCTLCMMCCNGKYLPLTDEKS